MRNYTQLHRREISHAFQVCHDLIWDGISKRPFHGDPTGDEFICFALFKSQHPAYREAREIVTNRLLSEGTNNLESWLVDKGYQTLELKHTKEWTIMVQAHRKAWVKKLIKEFRK